MRLLLQTHHTPLVWAHPSLVVGDGKAQTTWIPGLGKDSSPLQFGLPEELRLGQGVTCPRTPGTGEALQVARDCCGVCPRDPMRRQAWSQGQRRKHLTTGKDQRDVGDRSIFHQLTGKGPLLLLAKLFIQLLLSATQNALPKGKNKT